MMIFMKLFDMTHHSQVVARACASAFALAILTAIALYFVWTWFFEPSVHYLVWRVQIVAFCVTIVISFPVLFALFHMAWRVALKNGELQRLANLDPLTGLYNRRALAQRYLIGAANAAAGTVVGSLLVIDIDKFKSINDTFGHDVGDKVLVHLAGLLLTARGDHCYLARTGGEEFVIMDFSKATAGCPNKALDFAEHIRAIVEASPMAIGQSFISLTVSIGVASIQAGSKLETVLRLADDAMYQAKHNGRNRVVSGISDASPRTPSLVPDLDDLLLGPVEKARSGMSLEAAANDVLPVKTAS
jgi:diguanylate cyclase (GGDEF)-like protein